MKLPETTQRHGPHKLYSLHSFGETKVDRGPKSSPLTSDDNNTVKMSASSDMQRLLIPNLLGSSIKALRGVLKVLQGCFEVAEWPTKSSCSKRLRTESRAVNHIKEDKSLRRRNKTTWRARKKEQRDGDEKIFPSRRVTSAVEPQQPEQLCVCLCVCFCTYDTLRTGMILINSVKTLWPPRVAHGPLRPSRPLPDCENPAVSEQFTKDCKIQHDVIHLNQTTNLKITFWSKPAEEDWAADPSLQILKKDLFQHGVWNSWTWETKNVTLLVCFEIKQILYILFCHTITFWNAVFTAHIELLIFNLKLRLVFCWRVLKALVLSHLCGFATVLWQYSWSPANQELHWLHVVKLWLRF